MARTAPRTQPISRNDRTKAVQQTETAADVIENNESTYDVRLSLQEPVEPPKETLPVKGRPSRAAARTAIVALKRAVRDTVESVSTVEVSALATPELVESSERQPKRKANEIDKEGASNQKQTPQEPARRSISLQSISSLRVSETPPWDPNAEEIPVDFEWPPRKVVLGPAPMKPFREPLAFLHERLHPFGSYDYVPSHEIITPARRKAVNQELESIIQKDPKTGEIHYVCPNPLRGCTNYQKMVLNAAFNARRSMLIDHHRTKSLKLPLQEGDYGFVSVLARCTSDQVKAYFYLRADIEVRLLEYEAKEKETTGPTSTLAAQEESITIPMSNHTEALVMPPLVLTGMTSTSTLPTKKSPPISISTSCTISGRRITFARHNDAPPSFSDVSSLSPIDTTPSPLLNQKALYTGTNPEEGDHTDDDDDDGYSPTTPNDTHLFIKLEEEEEEDRGTPVASSWSINRCLTNNVDVDHLQSRLESDAALQGEDSAYILAHIAHLAKPLLGSELEHAEAGQNQGYEPCQQDYTSTSSPKPQFCCYCRASIFSAQFMCHLCTKSFCGECHASPTILEATLCVDDQGHWKEELEFCGRYTTTMLESFDEQLDKAYTALPDRLKNLLQARQDAQREGRLSESEVRAIKKKKKRKLLECRQPDRYHHLDLDVALTLFQQSWAQGVVMLLHGVEDRLEDMKWDLKRLVRRCGQSTVNAIQCTPLQTKIVMNVDKYFDRTPRRKRKQGMEMPTLIEKKDSLVLKMEGWPSQDFESLLPSHYANLMNALPLQDYTHPQGKFNLARYMPEDHPLKLNPTIYHGHGWGPKHKPRAGYGSIQLSCEPSDSLYLCVKSGAPYQEKRIEREVVIIWEIFRAEDHARVEAFLQTSNINSSNGNRSRTGEMEPTDPFTFGSTYLDDQLLLQLFEQTTHERDNQREEIEGVRPYRVEQAYGEAVMIPAGCLRQARFEYDATLVKVDFMSPERASWTLETTAWMRRCSLARQAAAAQQTTRRNVKFFESVPDTLQTRNVLLYSALAAANEE